jgi:subtilisin-like proprotein convertase family protein
VQGQSTTYAVSNAPTGGFASGIALSASPAIAGVSYGFAPNPVAAGGGSTLTVTTTAAATTGNHTVTISGTGGGLTRTTAVTLVINPPVAGDAVRTYSAAPNLAIPDNNATGVTSGVSVGASQTITSVAVSVSIVHTYRGDLVLTLIAPGGTTRLLHNRAGGSADNVITTYAIATTPAESLALLNGQGTLGTWQLRVQDLAAIDVGTLQSWSITFNGEKSVAPNLAIPDNNATGVSSAIAFTAGGTVASVRVRVGITHTYRGDLVVTLIAPDGTPVILHNRAGGSLDNLNTEYPDLTAPAQSLGPLAGKAIAGSWTLRVQDLAAIDVGTLNSWTISFTAQPAP